MIVDGDVVYAIVCFLVLLIFTIAIAYKQLSFEDVMDEDANTFVLDAAGTCIEGEVDGKLLVWIRKE